MDIHDLGAPADSEFRRHDGKRPRAACGCPRQVKDEYGGGFIGLLRPGLYQRMLDALPEATIRYGHELTSFTDAGDRVIVHLRDRDAVEADVLVGADGINSTVRRGLWGEQPIRQQKLHLVGRLPVLRRARSGDGRRPQPHHAGQLLRDPSRGSLGL